MSLILDFSDDEQIAHWEAVDDVVMGGLSSSHLRATYGGTALFSGELSLDHGGGFASVRSTASLTHSIDESTLVLRVRGDGRSYKLRLLTDSGGDEYSYLASFTTVLGAWTEHEFVAADFRASQRGRLVPAAPALDFKEVAGFGLLLADRRPGPFELELAWMVGR